jgi:hypothetical protein
MKEEIMFHYDNTIRILFIAILAFQLSSCSSVNQTWKLVDIVTKGERTDAFTDVVVVKNCGIIQPKTITCTAGTTSDLSVSLGGGLEVGEGAKVSVDGSVSEGLGIGQEAGENVNLENPPDGYIYNFTIERQYRVESGNAIAQSTSGKKQTASYVFNASCSIQVISKQISNCSDTNLDSSSIDLPGEIWTTNIQQPHKYQQYSISDKTFSDFSYEADVKINDNSSEFHGLMFGLQTNDKNFYSFRITPDGSLALDLWQDSPDNSFTRILGPVSSNSVIRGEGQTNHLKVVVIGGSIDLFINDQEVGKVTDNTYYNGRIGFVSCTCDGSSRASATFLNVKVSPKP